MLAFSNNSRYNIRRYRVVHALARFQNISKTRRSKCVNHKTCKYTTQHSNTTFASFQKLIRILRGHRCSSVAPSASSTTVRYFHNLCFFSSWAVSVDNSWAAPKFQGNSIDTFHSKGLSFPPDSEIRKKIEQTKEKKQRETKSKIGEKSEKKILFGIILKNNWLLVP